MGSERRGRWIALEAISVVGLDAGGGVQGGSCLFAPELIGSELDRVGGEVGDRRSGFGLLQDSDDLRFRESALSHGVLQ